MTAVINISDGEKSPEQPSNVAEIQVGLPDEARVERPEVAKPDELAEAKRQQQQQPRTEEPEPEEPRLVEPGTNGAKEENQAREQQQQQKPQQQQQQQSEHNNKSRWSNYPMNHWNLGPEYFGHFGR